MEKDLKNFLLFLELLAFLKQIGEKNHPVDCGCDECVTIKLSFPITLAL